MSKPGGTPPRSLSGKVLDVRAGLELVFIERLGGPLDRWTPRTIVSQEELRRVLADVRHDGYSVSDRQVTMDALPVGAPIRAADEEVIASLSVVVHVDGAEPAALGAAVRTAARGISQSIRSAAGGRKMQVSASPS